ncbi:MAG: glycerate kinase, partial [Aquihabitans sp.]
MAPDKFRGTATASEMARAISDACRAAGHQAIEVPLSDGGEGFLEAFGGANRTSVVTGPLAVPVAAGWRLTNHTAILEVAQSSGLAL